MVGLLEEEMEEGEEEEEMEEKEEDQETEEFVLSSPGPPHRLIGRQVAPPPQLCHHHRTEVTEVRNSLPSPASVRNTVHVLSILHHI